MPVLFNVLFLFAYSAFVHRYGTLLSFYDATPDYFILLSVYLFSKAPYSHLILMTASCAWCSDLFSGHNWASDACFIVLVHVALDRLQWCAPHRRFWIYMVSLSCIGTLHVLWSHWIHDQYLLEKIHHQILVNAVFALPFFYIFKSLKVGWGIRRQSGELRILNA